MFCKSCGKLNKKNTVYCASCGTLLNSCVQDDKRSENPDKKRTFQAADLRKIYIFDFLARLIERKNIPVSIYLMLNVLIVGWICTNLFSLAIWKGMLTGLAVYFVSVAVALSPVGEFIFRIQAGCKKITDPEDYARLMPLFEEVYHRAKKADSSLPDGIRIFINDEEEAPGAFAIGRRTLCVTRSLLALPDEMIKAAIGHEFGHLAHKDTDRILLVSVGNVFVTALFIFLKVVVIAIGWLFKIIGYLTFIPGLAVLIHLISTGVTYLLILLLHVLMLAWNGMGTLLCMKTNKGNEYSADRFSLELGYGDALCRVLLCTGGARLSGLFASLSSGHSDNEERVKRLIELGTVCDQLN